MPLKTLHGKLTMIPGFRAIEEMKGEAMKHYQENLDYRLVHMGPYKRLN